MNNKVLLMIIIIIFPFFCIIILNAFFYHELADWDCEVFVDATAFLTSSCNDVGGSDKMSVVVDK